MQSRRRLEAPRKRVDRRNSMAPLLRTSSLPTEAEEEHWRCREMQSRRRPESRQKAQADLHKAENEQFAKLSDIFGILETHLKFIIEAWSQIIECRRVLKWTYAYGYYLDDKVKSEFFDYLQGEAESGLERLHQCAEKDLLAFLPSSKPDSDRTMPPSVAEFGDFSVKLPGLTREDTCHTFYLCVAVVFLTVMPRRPRSARPLRTSCSSISNRESLKNWQNKLGVTGLSMTAPVNPYSPATTTRTGERRRGEEPRMNLNGNPVGEEGDEGRVRNGNPFDLRNRYRKTYPCNTRPTYPSNCYVHTE